MPIRWIKIVLTCIAVILIYCNKIPNESPLLQIPGFQARCIFIENFDTSTDQWILEGPGSTWFQTDSGLGIMPTKDSLGALIWINKEFEDDYQLEYKLIIADTMGMHLLFVSAIGMNDEDIFSTERNLPGDYNTYANGNMKNYQVSLHCYEINGKHYPSSRVRKNPGNLLMSLSEDPCEANREYTIDFMKIGNRFQLFVDGIRYHDFRDKGNRNDQYKSGKIGFWFSGRSERFYAYLKQARVFKLTPN